MDLPKVLTIHGSKFNVRWNDTGDCENCCFKVADIDGTCSNATWEQCNKLIIRHPSFGLIRSPVFISPVALTEEELFEE